MNFYTHDANFTASSQPLESIAVEPLMARGFESHPARVYETLRAKHGPVAPVDLLGVPVWLVLGYAEALDVLRNNSGIWYKSLDRWRAYVEGRVPKDWPVLPLFKVGFVLFKDPPLHTDLRNAWNTALEPFQGPAEAYRLESAVVEHADGLIEAMTGDNHTGSADLAAQYTRPLPLMIMEQLLGLENERSEQLLMDTWRMLDAGPDAADASQRLLTSLTGLASQKLSDPGRDFPSYMLAARPAFTADELAREMFALIGLMDLTGVLINNTIVHVILDRMSGRRPSLSFGEIKETTNRAAITNTPRPNVTFRFPSVAVKHGSYTIAAGDPVMVSVAAAHADPVFRGHLDRNALMSSRAHLSWGAGPHQCLGRRLATTISTIAVDRLFERISGLELDLPVDQLPWRPSPFFRGLRSLPVRYTLAAVPATRAGERAAPVEPSPPTPAPEGTHRSSWWRLLRSLRRRNNP